MLFDRLDKWTRAIIHSFIEMLTRIKLTGEEADYLIEKINKAREL